ncbi:MAG: hypothetical protein A2096_03645 [Spirochaetes bacterium GWF1_41_5]|nr:MAG: hypothetical protein A2096_03645 [Spirochaetes bacterium GWF1_41_5]
MNYCRIQNRKTVSENINIRFSNHYDVISAGAGTAGAWAITAAAKYGFKVLGIEQNSCVYGQGSAGGMFGYCAGSRGGLYEELDAELEKNFSDVHKSEAYKYLSEQFITASGGELSLESSLLGVYTEKRKICGVRFISPRGVHDVSCSVLIDSTAEAFACALAGCKTSIGRESDNLPQPYSSVRLVVDRDGSAMKYGLHNFDAGYVFQLEAEDLSQAVLHSTALHLKKKYEDDQLMLVCPMLGLREGRFITGEEQLRFRDFLAGRFTAKPVMYAWSFHDNHVNDWALESTESRDWEVVCSLFNKKFWIPVPMGAFIPVEFDNLLAAGRCMAFDHDMAQSVRMRRDMHKTGEIAGVMAALICQDKVFAKNINYEKLISELKKSGCFFKPQEPCLEFPPREKIRELLSSDAPGEAIRAAAVKYNMKEELASWLASDNENLSKHSALALGLLDDRRCLPRLYEMIDKYDDFMPKVSNPQKRVHAAIYLLGRLRHRESFEILEKFTATHRKNTNDFLYGLAGMLEIADCHIDLREKTSVSLKNFFTDHPVMHLALRASSRQVEPVQEDISARIILFCAKKIDQWKIRHDLYKIAGEYPLTSLEKSTILNAQNHTFV